MQSYLSEDRHSAEYNWLVQSKSPYLKQHETNPVNWLEWSPEAFEKAKRENKPVFLSIGYSTCHWCHVMAHESFENEEIATLLNERFVSIKVDREERPDIDSIYMSVCQAMTGQGGWPLNVFLTPDQVPYYVGTYFPKESRYGQPSFKEVISQLYERFIDNRDKIDELGKEIQETIRPKFSQKGVKVLDEDILHQCFKQLDQTFDSKYGGFGNAPKFPIPHQLTYLLRYYRWTKDETALHMVTKTLHAMADGGIYDHMGCGFARYSTDEQWLVPHFEKMLYDNALLLLAYTEAFQVTNDVRFRQVAEEIVTYVRREMKSEEGAFYSAEDADTEGEEGKYYVWDPDEVIDVLGTDLGNLFCDLYDISRHGNFEGKSIPHLIGEDIHRFAKRVDLKYEDVIKKVDEAKRSLFAHRKKRVLPHKDDKILTSWNGLMIAALAKAGRVFSEDGYTTAAKEAMQFVENTLTVDGRLMVRYRDGEVKYKGFIDDYANLLWGYIELYEATLQLDYLKKARNIANEMMVLFWDEENGGFYFYGEDQEQLFVRPKEAYDGAMPSGNSVAALQLLRLARLTQDSKMEERVHELIDSFAELIAEQPIGYTYLLQTVLLFLTKMKEVVVIPSGPVGDYRTFVRTLQQGHFPEVTLLVGHDRKELAEIAPFTKEYVKLDNRTNIYVCENFACNQPTDDIETALEMIRE